MQKNAIGLVVNLVGLKEAVFNILGYEDNKEGRDVLHKVIETAVDVAAKKGKELGDSVTICMTESDGAGRFAALDGEKYGKNSVLKTIGEVYSQGVILDASQVEEYTNKSEPISESNKLSKMLNGGLLVNLQFNKEAKAAEIKKSIEKTASLTNSFRITKQVPICGECGYKDQKLGDKCPKCKSPYII